VTRTTQSEMMLRCRVSSAGRRSTIVSHFADGQLASPKPGPAGLDHDSKQSGSSEH